LPSPVAAKALAERERMMAALVGTRRQSLPDRRHPDVGDQSVGDAPNLRQCRLDPVRTNTRTYNRCTIGTRPSEPGPACTNPDTARLGAKPFHPAVLLPMSGAQSFGRGRTSLETDMVRSGCPGVRRARDNARADSDTDHASCTQHEPVAHTGQQTQSTTSAKFVTSAVLAELVHPLAELTDLNTYGKKVGDSTL
jgi:hypothetical protein